MSLIKTVVSFPSDSALPADICVNTWYFGTVTSPPVDPTLDLIEAALNDFYSQVKNVAAGSYRVEELMSPLLNQTVGRLQRHYNLADSKPRTPIRTTQIAGMPAAASSKALARETAICVSYQAAASSGLPQARRRGRVYIGPLNDVALHNTSGRPSDVALQVLQKAADDLVTASKASSAWSWVVQAGIDTDVPGTITTAPVDNGWVDNEFDTQRRRGMKPTQRLVFS